MGLVVGMTFSLIAHCPNTGQFGLAATTAVPAVGKLLTYAMAGVGAVATQARLNPYLGLDGIRLLERGISARDVIEKLRSSDPCIEQRQFALVDNKRRTAAWTGSQCLDWAGHREAEGVCAQGNRLQGPEVLDAVVESFQKSAGQPLSRRLIGSIVAGGEAGGDKDGALSATLYVVDTEEYPLWDIRVDEDASPIDELKRLYDVFERDVIPHIREMPTRSNPGGTLGDTCV